LLIFLEKNLHIVTLNIPFPPDYGGMIDCYHRIRSLFNAGINIHLHAYEYGRPHSKELESLCKSVRYYPGEISLSKHISFLPFSVVSRKSYQLLDDLSKDDYPILFDGIQTTIFLDEPSLVNRVKAVRIYNIEPRYYRILARYETNPIRKLYYYLESLRFINYEKILGKSDFLLTVSFVDHDHYNSRFHNSILLPSSHPYDDVEIIKGKGDYILYHGDLSVNENIAVSDYLVTNIFSKIPFRCIIAGKNPPGHLSSKIARYNNIELIENPENKVMDDLIRNAQINILPTLASNGLKIKLLISLYSGRHCIVNSTTINGSGLYSLCHIADTDEKMIQRITSLIDQPFTEDMIEERKIILSKKHDNTDNAGKLIELFFPGGK